MRKTFLLFIFFVLAHIGNQNLYGQFRTDYFSDSIPAWSDIIDAKRVGAVIYTVGNARDTLGVQPVVRKLDTLGNVLWASKYNGQVSDYSARSLLVLGNNIYTTCANVPGVFLGQISRLDAENGRVIFNETYAAQSNIRLLDYDTTRLLAAYFYGNSFRLRRVSKASGVPIDEVAIQSYELSNSLTAAPNAGVFYSLEDTIFKVDYQNFLQKTWVTKVKIPNVNVKFFNRLVLDEPQNALFAFGMAQFRENLFVARLNATTGAVDWTYRSPLGDGYAPGQVLFEGNFVYVSWQHIYVGGGAYQYIVTKLNSQTGEKIWEIITEQVPNNITEQANRAMTSLNGVLYLTGYYDADNYGPGKWGVIALNQANGAVVFRTTVPPHAVRMTGEKLSVGRAIIALSDRIVVLGDAEKERFETYQNWVEIHPTSGQILRRKIHGGNYKYPSAATHLVQLTSGKIINLQQQGRHCMVKQMDGNGNVSWVKDLTAEFGLQAVNLTQVRGDSFIVTGFSFANETDFYSNFQATKTLQLYLINGAGTVLKTLSRPWQGSYKNVSSILRDPQAEQYFMTFQDGGSTRVGRFTFAAWQGETQTLGSFWGGGKTGNQALYKPINSNVLYFYGDRTYAMDVTTWPSVTPNTQNNISNYYHIAPLDSMVLACGVTLTRQPFVGLYKGQQLFFIKEIPNQPTLTSFTSFVQGETKNIVYLLAEGPYRCLIYKLDLTTWTILWTSPVFELPLNNAFRIKNIVFNPLSKIVTVSGAWSNPNLALDWQVFVKSFDGASGGQLLDYFKNSTFRNTDEALCALADRNSTSTIIGGHINQDGIANTTGFLHFFDNDFSNSVNARVFWDVNDNGRYDPATDLKIGLGTFLLDQTTTLYVNDKGLASVKPAAGIHQLTFQLPVGWRVTTPTITHFVNTLTPPTDTFSIGLRPDGGIKDVQAYLTGTHFVCDDTAMVYIFVKNNGSTPQQVQLRLAYNGRFLSADQAPNSLLGDSLYWNIPVLSAGGQWLNPLKFKMPNAAALGDSIRFDLRTLVPVSVTSQEKDTTFFPFRNILRCAFDPNDKTATPAGVGAKGLTLFNTWLHYTVRFQNTGNFPARNVVIRDTLDTNLEATTFEFLGSSHPITSIVLKGNSLEFAFKNIYLPDSTTNFNASQGFISFKVKPKTNLPEMTPVRNAAFIYFDANPAIRTNTTLNTYASKLLTGTNTPHSMRFDAWISPNPNGGTFTVELSTPAVSNMSFKITDLLGRGLIEKQVAIGSTTQTIEATSLADGLYLFQVVVEGKIVAIKKFVKQ